MTWQSLLKSSVAAPVRREMGENWAFLRAAVIVWEQDRWNGWWGERPQVCWIPTGGSCRRRWESAADYVQLWKTGKQAWCCRSCPMIKKFWWHQPFSHWLVRWIFLGCSAPESPGTVQGMVSSWNPAWFWSSVAAEEFLDCWRRDRAIPPNRMSYLSQQAGGREILISDSMSWPFLRPPKCRFWCWLVVIGRGWRWNLKWLWKDLCHVVFELACF